MRALESTPRLSRRLVSHEDLECIPARVAKLSVVAKAREQIGELDRHVKNVVTASFLLLFRA